MGFRLAVFTIAALSALSACRGCRRTGASATDAGAAQPEVATVDAGPSVDAGLDGGDPDVVEIISVTGFDPNGEPTIRRMRDGSLTIMFEFMPPSWAEGDDDATDRFDRFDRELAKMVGVTVEQEDRERFVVPRPRPDTVERLRGYLSRVRAPR